MKRNNVTSLRHEIRRQRRNNILLLLIVSIYTISWLPFNISYILFTYADRFRLSGLRKNSSPWENLFGVFFVEDKSDEWSKYLPLRFLICMISAISNPFLYCYFNESFEIVFQKIFRCSSRTDRRVEQKSMEQHSFQNSPRSILLTQNTNSSNLFSKTLSSEDKPV